MALNDGVVGLDSGRALVGERHAGVADEARALQHVGGDQGLEYIELKVSGGSAERNGHVVPDHLSGDHREGLGLGRVDLAGHDARSGFVVRNDDFANT